MHSAQARALVAALVLLSSAAMLSLAPRATADPFVVENPDGTADTIWNFTNPADYALTDTEIAGGTLSLRQETLWWNTTTAGDFAGPDSATNVDLARYPGDVVLAATSSPSTLLTLQPAGGAGVDAWLDRNNANTNHGSDATILLDGRNPQSRPILLFDVSGIPAGAVIDDATLNLYESAGVGASFTASVQQVTATWDETQVTWNDRLTGTPWGNAGGDFSGHIIGQTTVDNTAGWKSWNVTQLVDLWYRGRLSNQGFVLTGPNTGADADKTFYSSDYNVDPTRRPRLDIRYRTLGATGEYVSKVGGPGTQAQWGTISWNPSARSYVSDEFSGGSLDPKWTWTNPAPSYDVGATTPGHLHVVSSTASELFGGLFTGNVLQDYVAGDFNATTKFDTNPTVGGQKAGLIALLSPRDWYGIQKRYDTATGTVRWQIRATVDAVTTTRVDVPNGNPIPVWVRIVRTGNSFQAWTSDDGTAWVLRDTYAPAYEYPVSIRLGFFVADGLSGTALAVDVDYLRVTHGPDATVAVSARTGDVSPVDGTWTGWSASYGNPLGSPIGGASRYLEFRLSLAVSSPDHTPVVGDVNVSWSNRRPAGTVETADLVPGDVEEWGNFTTIDAANGQTLTYAYSLDGGGVWTPVVPPASLQAVSVATGRIRFRASLSTTDTLVTPTISEMRLSYRHSLDHFHVTASPTAAAGAPFSVTVTAKDATNTTLAGWTGTVTLAAVLLDGITPGGGTLGTTSLAVVSGGTATLATETYTRAETIRISATYASVAGLSGGIDVSPGPVDRITVAPPSATLLPFDVLVFSATGYDFWNNTVPGVSFSWAVVGGVGTLNTSSGPSVMFTAQPPAGVNGTLEASFGGRTGSASIRVETGTRPSVSITSPVPGAHVTGIVAIQYSNSTDAVLVTFEANDGTGWTLIGSTGVLTGSFPWDTSGLDFVGGSLRATVENNRTVTNTTTVTPIEVDNTPPSIALGAITDNQGTGGTISIAYSTAADVVRVDLRYYDGAWRAIGSDVTVDGSFVWTPGTPINGVTLEATAVDDVGLTGVDVRQGVGNRTVGSGPPGISGIPDLHVHVGTPYALNLTFYVTDPDTPLASLAVSVSDPGNVTASPGVYPTLVATYGSPGTYVVTLWISDGTDTAWTFVRIVASAGNPPSVTASLPSVMFDEDATATNALGAPATSFFSDADLDPVGFAVLGGAQVSARVNGDTSIDLWAAANWSGSELLRVRATDPSGGFAESALVVVVRPVNDAPVLARVPDLSIDEGATVAFDLTPFISDIDTNLSQLVVTTDSPYVTANGFVLTVAFPADRAEATFTITLSDGSAMDSQPVRAAFIPPWWKAPYVLAIPPVGILAVFAVFAQRMRWRPARAFLVDERKRLLREFTLDPKCDVTFGDAEKAGALDAVEKPVRVAKYHAQTVRGDALAVTLLTVGPITIEQIEFAREMLVNIQDKFEDGVKTRLEETREFESRVAGERRSLDDGRTAFDLQTRAFAGMMDALTSTQSKLAGEAAAVREKVLDLERREVDLRRNREALEARSQEISVIESSLESRVAGVTTREQGADERHADLDVRESRIAPTEKDLARRETEVSAREGEIARQSEALTAKAIDLEERSKALAAGRTSLEQGQEALESGQASLRTERSEFESRSSRFEEESRRRSGELDALARSLTEKEQRLAGERAEFEGIRSERTEWIASKEIEIESREQTLGEKETAVRAQAEENARHLSELAAREETLEIEADKVEKARAEVDARRADLERLQASLEARETKLREEEARRAAEFREWQSTMESQQALLRGQREAFEKEKDQAQGLWATRTLRAEQKEAEVAEREGKVQEDVAWVVRTEEEVKKREAALQESLRSLDEMKGKLEGDRSELERQGMELESRDRRVREEAAKLTDSFARRSQALKTAEAEFDERRGAWEKEATARDAHARETETTLDARGSALDGRASDLGKTEARLAESEAGLKDLEARLARERTDLEAMAQQLQAREVEINQARQRVEEDGARAVEEAEASRRAIAGKESELTSERERLERESRSLQERLGARAQELATREKAIEETEGRLRSKENELDARIREVESRERQSVAHAAELQAQTQAVARREKEVGDASRRLAEQEAQKRQEWEALQAALAKRETDISKEADAKHAEVRGRASEVDRRERGLAAAMAQVESDRQKLAEAAKAQAAKDAEAAAAWTRAERRFEELQKMEADLLRGRQSFESEKAQWAARRADELKALDKTRDGVADQVEKAEKASKEAERRLLVAEQQETAAKRQADELGAQASRLESRRKEVEGLERNLERQTGQLEESSRRLVSKEMDLEARGKDLAGRETALAAATRQASAAADALRTREGAMDQEAKRIAKASADLHAARADVQARTAAAEAKVQEVAQRERVLTTELQRADNLIEDLNRKQEDLKVREKSFADAQADTARREADLGRRDAALREGLDALERTRREIQEKVAEVNADRSTAAIAQEEALAMKRDAEGAKTQAEAMQQEVSKSMKFLQKKAVDVLDREEKTRERHAQVAEAEKALEARAEILDSKERSLEVEREELTERADRLKAEVEKLKARLADAEKSRPSEELEEWRKDMDNRVKIVQRKAMELLDREEKLRKKEEELRELAERLGVRT